MKGVFPLLVSRSAAQDLGEFPGELRPNVIAAIDCFSKHFTGEIGKRSPWFIRAQVRSLNIKDEPLFVFRTLLNGHRSIELVFWLDRACERLVLLGAFQK